jgi:transposase
LQLELTGGHVHEASVAARFFNDPCEFLICDKGYDSDQIRELCDLHNVIPVIPGRECRRNPIEYDRHIYKERNVVERFFAKVKQYRRVATRYDKTAIMYLGGVTLVSILLWLKV